MGNICCCASERKKKFMDERKTLTSTTDSCKKSKVSDQHKLSSESKDVISSFPEDVLLHILSFLDIKVAVQTSLLSKRWRYFWRSLRVLNYDQRFYRWFKKYPFSNSLDKVISVLPDVHEMHLKLSSELPQGFFTWKSIRVLKLKGVDGFLWLRNPHSVDLPALKALHLTRLVLDSKLVNDVLCKCPVIEMLSLKCCEFINGKNLNISSPQLKELIIIAAHKKYGCLKHYEMRIFAPKLTFFKCREYATKSICLDNLSALVTADIDLTINEHVALSTTEYVKRVMKFLQGFCHAECVRLSASSVEIITSAMEESQGLSTQFSNLRQFDLTASPDDACSRVLQLLKTSPNIENLLLEITRTNLKSYQGRLYWDEPPFYSTVMDGNWEADSQFQCVLCHLKSVEIRNFLGCENEIKLLKVLLKKAIVLEKIKIVLAQVWSHSREKMMWAVWKMLQTVPRAPLNVTLEFVNFHVLEL